MASRLSFCKFKRFLLQAHRVNLTRKHCFHERVCIREVISSYHNRLDTRQLDNVYRVPDIPDPSVHTLILSARPDEFEKLPPKCSSCGVILQTELSTRLGFVPEKKFLTAVKEEKLHKLNCYSCYRLEHYNEAPPTILNSNDVLDSLRHLRQRKALILYIVDMFDIEGTQFEKILQVVGKKKRLIIVGNKVDRLPTDDKKPVQQLEHMKDILKNICYQNGLADCNFRDICLVSARTGYGLHALVEKINKHRDVDMDVYLVGCANTGKSTLYNSIVNLLNAHKSSELPPQAIEHHIPGTTRGLIRQGISMRRLQRLQKRLLNGPWEVEEEFSYDKALLDLVGFKEENSTKEKIDPILLESPLKSLQSKPLEFVDLKNMDKIEKPCFIYDTPGIINDSEIIRYLTPKEINYLAPTRWIVPRSFVIKPGNCMFIGGLARLDYNDIKRQHLVECDKEDLVESAESIYVTTMISPNVPIHVTITETADEKYQKLFVNNVLEIPVGSEERFEEFPALIPKNYIIKGKNRNINACDLVLHGVGWISIAAVLEANVNLTLHTPDGIGQSLRTVPLLPYSVRKKEGRGVSYRGYINNYMYGHNRKRSPQFIRIFEKQNDPIYSWKKKIKQKMKQEIIQAKEQKRLQRLENGVILGRMKSILDKEEKLRLLEDKQFLLLKESQEK